MSEKTNPPINPESICQVGLIVRDIERTARAWAGLFGLAMPQIITSDPIEKAHTEYRGAGTAARARLAFFQFGAVSIELIEPDGNPSTWQEYLESKGEGVHHIAFTVSGTDEKIEALAVRGMPLEQRGDYTGGRYAYIDTREQLKVALELLENLG